MATTAGRGFLRSDILSTSGRGESERALAAGAQITSWSVLQGSAPKPVEAITRAARSLRLTLDRRKYEVWQSPPTDRIDRLDPEKIAIEILGVNLIEEEDLGTIGAEYCSGNLPRPLGAYVDRTRTTIGLAMRFRKETRRFTLSHAIGHWQLHTTSTYLCDGPLSAGHRPGSEKRLEDLEADLFAEELLMPAELIRPYFHRLFRVETYRGSKVTAAMAAWLSNGTERQITGAELTSRGREYLALLLAEWLPGERDIPSLASRFGVSGLAMAIRLERLCLV